MARFVDLEESGDAPGPTTADAIRRELQVRVINGFNMARDAALATETEQSTEKPRTTSNAITNALSCYPIIVAIASSIDLNTLDALARTSRDIHDGLIQYRTILLTSTLRCSNETLPVNRDELLRYSARASNWHYMEDGRSYNGKSGDCAHDMVDECRKCGEVICRNCAIKPPAPVALRERHSRLCITCARAPIGILTHPPLDADTPFSSEAVQRAVCKCDTTGVWLCQPCGRSIRGADHEYQRIWRWRNQYGEVLGGLGTGIGDGDRGVICGREEDCLAARDREQEIDCDAEDARDNGTTPWIAPWIAELPSPASGTGTTSPAAANGSPFGGAGTPISTLIDEFRHENERTPSPQLGPGYERHEIEGIGGKVKRKLVRMVRVGACVPEWDDEKGVLGPEVRACARSWCGWCWRVIPGKKDIDEESSSVGSGRRESS
ncbi:hypothetical protein TOPH_06979 [Tolypocladium ophioglossoides CBS 100239]|uniref:Uncharacterized protein n=1 Tax=Tolypocladium ophioglossoides (strain CBS 100239) TaxID=1163406 RepID=A0A0L0N2P2_TOLOC|nr:hypothetical protein TOPH_06979 [Tolypocladium ophioglossoides CBS 100239]